LICTKPISSQCNNCHEYQMSNTSVKNLIPHFIQEKEMEGIRHGGFDAYTMFVDLSGFTSMTETLLQQGKAGAERLSKILNAIFVPMVEKVYAHGGFIPYFAGDAFTGVFMEGESGMDARQLIQLSVALHAQLKAAASEFGEFRINIKTGLSAGPVEWGIVGQEHKSFYFRGASIYACANSQQKATKDQIILDDCVRDRLKEKQEGIAPLMGCDGHFLVENGYWASQPEAPISANGAPPPEISKKIAARFLPEAVIRCSYLSKALIRTWNLTSFPPLCSTRYTTFQAILKKLTLATRAA
jgi:class 3 adenylate cyclase